MAFASYKLNQHGIPRFGDLPLQKGDPPHSAWGLYGEGDELGTLNRLTNERVVEAARTEIQSGVRISLNWPLSAQRDQSFFARQVFHQELIHKSPRVINDDVWTFNSQVSSQWDGLRHFAYQKEERFYGGVTLEDIHGVGGGNDGKGGRTTVLGIQAIAEHGIVGRGVLLDFHSWREAQSPPIPYDAFKTGSIPLKYLRATAESQGTVIKFGDILIIRSGYMSALAQKSTSEIAALQAVNPPTFSGVEQSEDMLQWIWENFSAVAGDQPSFECWPRQTPWALHEVLLAGWGCPIGELFDLEKLAEHCRVIGRWSFFVTSEVCNVPGGVASPPNILAIF